MPSSFFHQPLWFAIAGYTNSFGAGSYDFYLVKADSAGTMLWNKTFGGAMIDQGYSLIQTVDGGYAIAGFTISPPPNGADVYLVKTDAAGTMLWNKTYGGTRDDFGFSLIQMADGGYAIAGNTNSSGAGSNDVYLVKTDSSGNMQWSKTYGGAGDDYGRSVVLTVDGGYAIAGSTSSFGAGSNDVYLVKTDVESEFGLAMTDSTANTLTLYRGRDDVDWNYVRVRVWKID